MSDPIKQTMFRGRQKITDKIGNIVKLIKNQPTNIEFKADLNRKIQLGAAVQQIVTSAAYINGMKQLIINRENQLIEHLTRPSTENHKELSYRVDEIRHLGKIFNLAIEEGKLAQIKFNNIKSQETKEKSNG